MPGSAQRRPWLLTGQQTPRASLPLSLTDGAEARAGPEGTRSSLRVHSEWLACLKPSVPRPDPHVPSCEGQLSSYVGKKDSPKQNEQTNKQTKQAASITTPNANTRARIPVLGTGKEYSSVPRTEL